MNLGIKSIDDDHKALFDLFNQFFRALMSGEALHEVGRYLDRLIALTSGHIKSEEDAMEKINYPYLDKHRARHRELMDKMKSLKDLIAANAPDVEEKVLNILDEWKSHTIEFDSKLVEYARTNKIQLSLAA